MKNTKKLLTIVALTTIIAGTSMSFAADTTNTENINKSVIKSLMQKVKNGETLTDEETATLETAKANFKGKRGGERGGKGMRMPLTDEEKTSLESMTDEEKKEFFTKKREEKKLEREAHRKVIDKLLAGETLTTEEENLRAEIIKKRAERQKNREEMKTKREEMKTILDKKKAGETLTTEEQTILDNMKEKGKNKGPKRGAKMNNSTQISK